MLKDTEFAYAVARIRSNETGLLSSAVVENVITAPDYKEALRVLSEAGYADFQKDDEDKVLSGKQRQAVELIYEVAPEKSCIDFLIVKNDFHNIKALLKGLVTGKDVSSILLTPSVIDVPVLKSAIENKDYESLGEPYSLIVKEAYELLTSTMDGQKLEVFLDRKCLEASLYLANRTEDDFSIDLAKLMTILTDIKIALRCALTSKDTDFIDSAICECDGIDKERLCLAAHSGVEALAEYVNVLGFSKLSQTMGVSYAAFEKAFDDILLDKIRDAKYKCLGTAPLVAYYFATDAEVKTVRIVLSCKKNGISQENIRERVRELYV